jgi:hypothetical protein
MPLTELSVTTSTKVNWFPNDWPMTIPSCTRNAKGATSKISKLGQTQRPIERDADPFFLAPYDTAGDARTVRSQYELIGDANWAWDIQHGPGVRSISNPTRERAAAELNRPDFQNATTGGATLIHWRSLGGTLNPEKFLCP